MQYANGTIDQNSIQPKISQSDKLMFCGFIAIAFHAMLLFGVGFKVPNLSSGHYQKSFNVVLAQFETQEKTEKADFKAQANQEGGGESDKLLAPSVTELAQFNDPNSIAQEPQSAQTSSISQKPVERIMTGDGKNKTALTKPKEQNDTQTIPDSASLIDRSFKLAGRIANLDNQNINQAKKNRKRQVSASTHRSSDALYLDSWRRKIERVGNQNYPIQAKINQIYGNVTMKVAINRDGTIYEVAIMESSGNKLLDNAALKIVHLAAPFQPLSNEMTQDTDILEVIRVWQFQPNNKLKAN